MKKFIIPGLLLGALGNAFAGNQIICMGQTSKSGAIVKTVINLDRLSSIEDQSNPGSYIKPKVTSFELTSKFPSGLNRRQSLTQGSSDSFGWVNEQIPGLMGDEPILDDEYIHFQVNYVNEYTDERIKIDYQQAYDYAFDYADKTLEEVLLDKEIEAERKQEDQSPYLKTRIREMVISSNKIGNYQFQDTVCAIKAAAL